ncbi:coiled-coil domain-containing protein 39 [Denticeps clupeoides]|uniref:Coiled-coil domain-containing protein 39 n=1 Tax=Denticeps clupeoides TaxID=299321 RepID=A0AAY4B0W0_9TELE|nr:coiled-coil domain-containing protein 39 [Denticeps clupeoides]
MSVAGLSELSWDAGFAIPVANSENKLLEDEITRKQREKSRKDNRVAGYSERVHALTEHLRNVRQEVTHAQVLDKAREKQTDSETHCTALDERERGRLHQGVVQMKKELQALMEKKTSQEDQTFKSAQKLDTLKCQMKWDQQTLDAWLDESARRDEDTMAIIKYAQQEESRIRDLTLAVEKKSLQCSQKKKVLDNHLTETMAAQVALDKTVENMRQARMERQDLISQWESPVLEMRKRDQEIEQCTQLLAQVNQEKREKTDHINEKKDFLESEVQNNKEFETKITKAERLSSRLRQQLQAQERNRGRLQDELESLKGVVGRAALDVDAARSQMSSMKKDAQDKSTKVEEVRVQNAALEGKLEALMQTGVSKEERAQQMELLLMDKERRVKDLDVALQRQREALFRKTQQLQVLRQQEKDMSGQLSASRVVLTNLTSRLRALDLKALKQEEIIYNQDFQIQLLERKRSRLQGETNAGEKKVLETRVSELSSAVDDKRRTLSSNHSLLRKLQDGVRHVMRKMERTGAQKQDLTTKSKELNLYIDASQKELKTMRQRNQDTMVDGRLLKLEVQHLRDLLYARADGVLSLETQRLQLQTKMKEKHVEVRLHCDLLTKQSKITEQECQALRAEVQERMAKVDKMGKRYESLILTGPDLEEERSQAYYVIKAAQEKEELQQNGDELERKMRKAELEMRALENTLHVVNSRNTSYRQSFSQVTESSEEFQQMLWLEKQKEVMEEKVRLKRRHLRDLQDDVQGMTSTLSVLELDEVELRGREETMQSSVLAINKELFTQREKLQRVKTQSSKITKETKQEMFQERDLQLWELKEIHRTINSKLLEAMEQNPVLTNTLQVYFAQANLPLPTPGSTLSSRRTSKASSARSSVSPRTVDLGMGLSVTSPPRVMHPPSSSSSSRSSRSSQAKSP